MHPVLVKFIFRWVVSSLGLWIAAAMLGEQRLSVGHSWGTVIGAGLILALVNMALKPILLVLSFPAIVLSLGLFMLVVNGAIILIADWLYDPLEVKNLGVAVITGIIIGFVNFLVSHVAGDMKK